jgi:hypothetical protein
MLALAATMAAAAAAFSTPAPVQALGLDTPLLAYAGGRAAGDCDRVRVWNRATRRTVRLGRTTSCEQTSTGTGIAAVSIAGKRVLWLHFTGGNIREWSLFTATTTAPRPRRIRFVARDVDAPPPIVLGEGDTTRYGELLPYAVDREVVVLMPNGSRAFAWTAPARVTAIGANWGGVAVAVEDGRVFVLENGAVESSWSGSPSASAVFITGNGVALQRGRTVELRTGSSTRRWTIPAGARLRDAEGLRAVYLAAGRAQLLNLSSGETRDLGRATDVQLESSTAAVGSGRAVRVLRVG